MKAKQLLLVEDYQLYDWKNIDVSKLNCDLIAENNEYAVYNVKDPLAATALGAWVEGWYGWLQTNFYGRMNRAMQVLQPRKTKRYYYLPTTKLLFFLPKDPTKNEPYYMCICRYTMGETGKPTPFIFYGPEAQSFENNTIPGNKSFPVFTIDGISIGPRRGDTGIVVDPDEQALVDVGLEVRDLSVPNGVKIIATQCGEQYGLLRSISIPGSVQAIENSAFENCPNLTKVVLNNGIMAIGLAAFDNCAKLEEINLPDSLLFLGQAAFHGTAIKKIALPPNVDINKATALFSACYKLEECDVPASLPLKTLPYRIFQSTKVLKTITIPNSVTAIDRAAFQYSGIETITLPASVQTIEYDAFEGTTNLTSIKIPASVRTIGAWAFHNSGIKDITIENGVQEIYSSAFYGANNLEEIILPDSVIKLHSTCFNSCEQLKTVKIGNGLTTIPDGTFSQCKALTTVDLSNNITTIEGEAFRETASLTNISLPNSLEKLGRYAFVRSGLKEITLPSTVNLIEVRAFFENSNLTKVYLNSLPEIQGEAFVVPQSLEVFYNGPTQHIIDAFRSDTFNSTSFSRRTVFHCSDGDYTR